MNNKDKRQQILEKIQKLQRHAESAEKIGNLEEATAAAGRISEMMLKYNIELHELLAEDGDTLPIEFEIFDFSPYWKRNESNWLLTLMNMISKNTMARIIANSYSNPSKFPYRCKIYGEQHNIYSCISQFNSIHSQIRYLSQIAWKSYRGPEKRNTWYRGYHEGALIGLWNRFKEAKEKVTQEHGGAALVFIGQALERVESKLREDHPHTSSVRAKSKSSTDGHLKGRADANNISINTKGNLSNAIRQRRLN